jgi:hypothetical protein
LALAIT